MTYTHFTALVAVAGGLMLQGCGGLGALRASRIAVSACGTADVVSSWNRPERNPLLRSGDGTFGERGTVIKGAVFYAYLETQGQSKKWQAANWVLAGVNCAVAGRNARR